jgi:7,8-dihydropterin-6-yl-methyl-4-(beta-D-ribofuranosyl)aminobenzene 5'-phosphate synthase
MPALIRPFRRRAFLKGSVAVATGATAFVARRLSGASAPRIEAPAIDRLVIRVIIDTNHDIFISGESPKDVKVTRTRLMPAAKNSDTLEGQWGLSLHIETVKPAERRNYLLDFGYTPQALNHNLELLGVDVGKLDGLILSHGHLDHFGGLMGFLEKYRGKMREDLPLYTGGEDNFCYRYTKEGDKFAPFGLLDRRELAAQRVRAVLSEEPMILDGHAFTTGAVPRASIEHVLPNTFVEHGAHDGAGCDVGKYSHFRPDEKQGEIVADQHWHEQATCFNVKGKGLVVITSCGHGGIINNLRWVTEITGITKIHALVGGFHLAPAPADYLAQVMGELEKFDIDYVIPMHCSGANFLAAAKERMPLKLIQCTTGSAYTFGEA